MRAINYDDDGGAGRKKKEEERKRVECVKINLLSCK
jgi:hypothetical protein